MNLSVILIEFYQKMVKIATRHTTTQSDVFKIARSNSPKPKDFLFTKM